jgi:peptide/nickel transport system permease protein
VAEGNADRRPGSALPEGPISPSVREDDTGGSSAYPLGTDGLGRCVLSRAIYDARVALTVAIAAAWGTMLLGSALALLGGCFGGVVDRLISYVVDLWTSFPPVVLSLILLVGLGTGVDKVILAVVLVDWTRFCRVVRSCDRNPSRV